MQNIYSPIFRGNFELRINYNLFFMTSKPQRISEDTSIYADAGNVGHPHNETLFWMAEGGIAPLIGRLIIAGGFLVMLWRTKRKEAIGMAGMIMAILVHTQLELPFYLSLIHWFLFIFLLVCIDEEFGDWRVKKISLKIFPRVVAILIPGLIIPAMITVLQTGSAITKY